MGKMQCSRKRKTELDLFHGDLQFDVRSGTCHNCAFCIECMQGNRLNVLKCADTKTVCHFPSQEHNIPYMVVTQEESLDNIVQNKLDYRQIKVFDLQLQDR